MMQCLSQGHIDLCKCSFGHILLTLTTLSWLARLLLDSWYSSHFEGCSLDQTNFLSHRRLINDSIPNSSCFSHMVASAPMKLIDEGSHLFLSLSQVLDKIHLAYHLSHHLDLHCGYLSLWPFQLGHPCRPQDSSWSCP